MKIIKIESMVGNLYTKINFHPFFIVNVQTVTVHSDWYTFLSPDQKKFYWSEMVYEEKNSVLK